MKVIETKQRIIDLWTKDNTGRLIHIFQYDSPDWAVNKNDDYKSLSMPVLVAYGGADESIIDILESREKMRKEIFELKESLKGHESRTIKNILDRLDNLESKPKKWYQFWR